MTQANVVYRNAQAWIVTWLTLMVVAWPLAAFGQRVGDGRVHIAIDLLETLEGSRVYSEREGLVYGLTVRNESHAGVSVDQIALRKVFEIYVESPSLPVDVSWDDEVTVYGALGPGARFAAWQPLELGPNEYASLKVTVERQDRQRFEEGRYEVVFNVSGFETAIRRDDGTPWWGTTNANDRWRRGVTIRRPTNAQEQVSAYLYDVGSAMVRGDAQAAVDALLKASAADPGNRYVRLRLGLQYLSLERYQEAVAVYESLLAGVGVPGRAVAVDLARAYLGVGDEGNAVRVLRMSGVPEAEISGELNELRAGLR